jgi:hypothetical protein
VLWRLAFILKAKHSGSALVKLNRKLAHTGVCAASTLLNTGGVCRIGARFKTQPF